MCTFLNHGFIWIYAQEWDCWIIFSSVYPFKGTSMVVVQLAQIGGPQDALLGFSSSASSAHRAEEDLLNFLDPQLPIKDAVR